MEDINTKSKSIIHLSKNIYKWENILKCKIARNYIYYILCTKCISYNHKKDIYIYTRS